MDAVTYPDSDVQDHLTAHFRCLKIDLLARHPDAREASLGQKVVWAPAFVFSDSRHRELRRHVGWLPPEDFLAELRFVSATATFQSGDFAAAREEYARVAKDFADAPATPECLYWAGIAGFLAGPKDWAPLKQYWSDLHRRFPHSRFGKHASVIEDAPE